MKTIRQLVGYGMAAALLWVSFHSAAVEAAKGQEFETIEWTDLIPPDVLQILMNPPDYILDIPDGSAEDQISSQMQNSIAAATDDEYQQALSSTEVNAEMDGTSVRIPGFVVPLEFDDNNIVTQFFLVPYFGACLHMPPPPPNQIIMVNSPQGIELQGLATPFWIRGELSTSVQENSVATSAYAMKMHDYEIYTD